ncbi:MAG: hypothetical protein WBD87_14075 [Candidatus Acidiferrales bacterium]
MTLAGVRQVYFGGIDIADAAHRQPLVITGQNSSTILLTDIDFQHCTIVGDFVIAPDVPGTPAGFGLKMVNTSLNGNISATDFDQITIQGGFMHKIFLSNEGIGEVANINIDGTVSEALDNEDFMSDITAARC